MVKNIPCISCGYDPTRKVLFSHEETIKFKWLSGNIINPYGHQNKWRHKSYREGFRRSLKKVAHKFPVAEIYTRITMTRIFGKGPKGGRCYEYDLDNLAQGAKPMIDELVKCSILRNDSPEFAQVIYKQEESPDRYHYVRILVEELE